MQELPRGKDTKMGGGGARQMGEKKQIKTVSSLLLHPTPHWREGLYVSDLGEARNSLSSVWHDITSD